MASMNSHPQSFSFKASKNPTEPPQVNVFSSWILVSWPRTSASKLRLLLGGSLLPSLLGSLRAKLLGQKNLASFKVEKLS